jgi:hypothetical protein
MLRSLETQASLRIQNSKLHRKALYLACKSHEIGLDEGGSQKAQVEQFDPIFITFVISFPKRSDGL